MVTCAASAEPVDPRDCPSHARLPSISTCDALGSAGPLQARLEYPARVRIYLWIVFSQCPPPLHANAR